MNVELEVMIRNRAYELWELEGRPEGREHAHWEQALTEVAALQCGAPAQTEVVAKKSRTSARASKPSSSTASAKPQRRNTRASQVILN